MFTLHYLVNLKDATLYIKSGNKKILKKILKKSGNIVAISAVSPLTVFAVCFPSLKLFFNIVTFLYNYKFLQF